MLGINFIKKLGVLADEYTRKNSTTPFLLFK